jgi:hypothetical protein
MGAASLEMLKKLSRTGGERSIRQGEAARPVRRIPIRSRRIDFAGARD